MEKKIAEDPLPVIAMQIKRYRKAAGMTQQELADKCEIFRTYLSRIEGAMANPTVSVLANIAFNLNVGLTALLIESEVDQA